MLLAGAGKSILASVVIDHLRTLHKNHHLVGVASIYCNFKEEDLQTLQNLLASICVQLCPHRLPDALITLHSTHSIQNTRPTWKEINPIFKDCLTSHDTVYIIIDALDECSKNTRSFLLKYFETLPSNVRLLVTTRHVDEIARAFHACSRIEIRANDDDLRKYISSRIAGNSRLMDYMRKEPALKEIFCDEIILKADGM